MLETQTTLDEQAARRQATLTNMETNKTLGYIESGLLVTLCVIGLVLPLLIYTIWGTEGRVPELQKRAPVALDNAGFNILRYEGYQRGAWSNHGGKVWYQVTEKTNPNIRYRLYCILYNHEVQFVYGLAEPINNLQVDIKKP